MDGACDKDGWKETCTEEFWWKSLKKETAQQAKA